MSDNLMICALFDMIQDIIKFNVESSTYSKNRYSASVYGNFIWVWVKYKGYTIMAIDIYVSSEDNCLLFHCHPYSDTGSISTALDMITSQEHVLYGDSAFAVTRDVLMKLIELSDEFLRHNKHKVP